MVKDAHDEQWQREVAGKLGSIGSSLEAINNRLSGVESKVDGISSTVNRWKGATAIVGMLFGGLLTYIVKVFGFDSSGKV